MNLQNVDVTYLKNFDAPSHFSTKKLSDALKTISDENYKTEIERLRALDQDGYTKQKRNLPSLIFNGTFTGKVTNAGFNQSSDLFHFDIDGLEPATIESDKATLANLPSTVFCFVSPSGKGLKGALRLEHGRIKSDADFKHVYQHAEKMIKGAGYTLDKSCKDVRRLCFVSYDPKIYVNYDAEVFPIPEAQAEIKPAPPKKPKPKALASANKALQQQPFDAGKESRLIDRCLNIMRGATAGNRHEARLRAGRLAGGFIAGGLIKDEQKLFSLLLQVSDSVADGGTTTDSERQTLSDGISEGKLTPCDDGTQSQGIIEATLLMLDVDQAAWLTDDFKNAMLNYYLTDKQEYERLYLKLQKWKIATRVDREIKSMAKRHYNTNKAAPKEAPVQTGEYSSLNIKPIKRGALVHTHPETGEQSLIIQSAGAVIVAECLRDAVGYSQQALCWHTFTGSHWQALASSGLVDTALIDLLYIGAGDVGFTNAYKNNVKALIADGNFLPIPDGEAGLLPFQNGLLDYRTGELYPVTPSTAQTWSLPFNYDARADCPTIKAWLLQSVDNDNDTVYFLAAWLAALLHGRSDLQMFLHLIGNGGTGKGTFIRLAIALVGAKNTAATTLKEMETNRFETANFYEKRLVMITDSDKYGASINTLKAMTGQDDLRLERKYKQQTGGFVYNGLVFIASNESLATTDHTSGLDRRRSMVLFDRRVTTEEKEVWRRQGGESAVLHREMPGLVNWLLSFSQEDITRLIKNPPKRTQKANFEAMTDANPIAEWMTDCLYPAQSAWIQIGDKREIRGSGLETSYEKSDEWLYPNYLTWSLRQSRHPLSCKSFKAVLIDTLKTFKVVFKLEKTSKGSGFLGIRFRKDWEDIYSGWQPVK